MDQDARAWLATEPQKELVNAGVQSPLDSPHTDFLYLYGRANLLSGNTDEAGKAFDAAIAKADANPTPGQRHNQTRISSWAGGNQCQNAKRSLESTQPLRRADETSRRHKQPLSTLTLSPISRIKGANQGEKMSELKLQHSRLDGRYDVLECLGRGSYAEIYVANDNAAIEGAPRTIVIKALNLYLQGQTDIELERLSSVTFKTKQ